MGFQYGAGGKTLPKAGRLGSGAFFKGGHHPSMSGNVFGANWDKPEAPNAPVMGQKFGEPVQALLSTTAVGRPTNAAQSQQFPLNAHFQTASYNKLTAMPSGSSGSGADVSPSASVPQNKNIAPWEKTAWVHGRVNVKRPPFRATGGVNNSFKQDTAFQRNRPKTVAKANPAPDADHSKIHGVARPTIGSFQVGHSGQMWGDPNQSFLTGLKNPTNGRVGMPRWSVTKRGAAG